MSVCARCQRPACDLSRRACTSTNCGLRDQLASYRQSESLGSMVERVAVHAGGVAA